MWQQIQGCGVNSIQDKSVLKMGDLCQQACKGGGEEGEEYNIFSQLSQGTTKM